MTIQDGFGSKPTNIRIHKANSEERKAELWIEQTAMEGYTTVKHQIDIETAEEVGAVFTLFGGSAVVQDQNGKKSASIEVQVPNRAETLSYVVFGGLLNLCDECNVVVWEVV